MSIPAYDTLHRSVCIDICGPLVKSANMCFIGSLKVFVSITVTGSLIITAGITLSSSHEKSAVINTGGSLLNTVIINLVDSLKVLVSINCTGSLSITADIPLSVSLL